MTSDEPHRRRPCRGAPFPPREQVQAEHARIELGHDGVRQQGASRRPAAALEEHHRQHGEGDHHRLDVALLQRVQHRGRGPEQRQEEDRARSRDRAQPPRHDQRGEQDECGGEAEPERAQADEVRGEEPAHARQEQERRRVLVDVYPERAEHPRLALAGPRVFGRRVERRVEDVRSPPRRFRGHEVRGQARMTDLPRASRYRRIAACAGATMKTVRAASWASAATVARPDTIVQAARSGGSLDGHERPCPEGPGGDGGGQGADHRPGDERAGQPRGHRKGADPRRHGEGQSDGSAHARAILVDGDGAGS